MVREDRLVVRGLGVNFGGFVAVDDVNLTVEPGETRVVIGPNGAGKTTLLDLITGKTAATSGTVEFRGHHLAGKNTSDICRKYHVGRKFQGPNVFGPLTVNENMKLAMMGTDSILSLLVKKDSKEEQTKIDKCLKKVNLLEFKDIQAQFLSHGQKQWLEIGMIILQDARLVVLDEPTAGMTAEETYKTGEMINTNFKDKTMIVIEHDMDFVKQIADEVTVLHQGRVIAEGKFEEVEKDPKVISVYLKTDAEMAGV